MAVRRYLKKRGANVAVQAYGEILLRPTGDFGLWKRKVSQRVVRETRKEAPTNKRPRWGHYGDPLKSTFSARTQTRLTKGGGFIYSAVGSSAPHAYYVDQGTGIFNGSAPWKAKVLPPMARNHPSLYEHTWKVPQAGMSRGGWQVWEEVNEVYIKGQRGQRFFEKGLDRAWRSVGDARMKPIGGAISAASRTFPEGLADFKGNTPGDNAFKASLEEWRAWRDSAFWNGEMLGASPRTGSNLRRSRDRKREARAIRTARDRKLSSTAGARRQEQENRRKLAESRRLSEERRKRDAAELAERNERKRIAKERREEQERKIREQKKLDVLNSKTKRLAREFYAKIKQTNADASIVFTTLADGAIMYQVTYSEGGKVQRKRWGYGEEG